MGRDEKVTKATGSELPQARTAANRETPGSVQAMFASIAGRYDLANHLLSGGMDFFWRRRASRLVKSWAPARILDLATGSGDLALTLSMGCPDADVVAADFCLPMLAQASRKGLGNLVAADGMALPFLDQSFDAVTIGFGLRNMASWRGALGEAFRVLRPGGHVVVLDFAMPQGNPWRWVYRQYLHRVLPRIAACVTGQKSAYDYLGESIEKFPAGPQMKALLGDVGFVEADWDPLSGGIVGLYSGMRA